MSMPAVKHKEIMWSVYTTIYMTYQPNAVCPDHVVFWHAYANEF